ncbi:MAG: DUF1616 domain-containing protein [Dehalococcoidales bacterium]|nr:MAG: DUF1616 domain-containing protein [Dehalococcoidales bacterium]
MDWLFPVREMFDFILPFLDRFPFIRMLLGSILVFFLPGFSWTLVIFQQIRVIERLIISFALSFVMVTIGLLFSSVLVGIMVTGFNSVLSIGIIIFIPLAIYYLNRLVKRRKSLAA